MLFRETAFAYIYWAEGDGSTEDQKGLESMAEQTFDARRMARDQGMAAAAARAPRDQVPSLASEDVGGQRRAACAQL